MIRVVLAIVLISGLMYLGYALRREVFCDSNREKPRASITLYFSEYDCFEPVFLKTVKLYSCLDIELKVVDLINTPESAEWLEKLSKKTDIEFDIIN